MADPLSEVLEFFDKSSGPSANMFSAVQRWFTASTQWENVGVATTVGIEQANQFMQGFLTKLPFDRCDFIVHHAAVNGNVVLTERSDIFYGSDGQEMLSLRVMGITEMDGSHIVAWRDYFDTSIL